MEEWISMRDAGKLLGIAHNTLRKLIREGVLPAYQVKGVRGYQIKRSDVEALLTPVRVEPLTGKKKKKR